MDRAGRLAGAALAAAVALALCSGLPAGRSSGAAVSRPGSPGASGRPGATASGAGAAAADPDRAAFAPPVPPFPAQDRIGVLFAAGTAPSRHFCTASVVDSPHRDLAVTAAHCAYDGQAGGPREDLEFAPGLGRDGRSAAGSWRVTAVLVAESWRERGDPAADVAFLVLAPLDGRRVQDAVGGNPIAFDQAAGGAVQLVGYPTGQDTPVVCDGGAGRSGADQLRIYCPGFAAGTSGSPWLAAAGATGSGTVIGVIGGYLAGGSTAEVSYSSAFDGRLEQLYREAVAGS